MSGAGAKSILTALSRYGLDTAQLCKSLGVDESVFLDPEARVPQRVVNLLLVEAERVTGDPAIALGVTEKLVMGVSGSVVAKLAMASATVSAALEHVARYGPVSSEAMAIRFHDEGSTVLLELQADRRTTLRVRYLPEVLLASIRRILELCVPQPITPLRVAFRHTAPPNIRVYEEFFGCPVQFGARAHTMRFPSEPLQQPMIGFDPRTEARLQEIAESELRRLSPELVTAVREQVRIAIEKQERPDTNLVAKHLGMAARTLQRRLREEGASFRVIVEETRRDIALSMLQEPGRRVVDVAVAVGFDEATSFSKAFRRWMGQSPTDYQARRADRVAAQSEAFPQPATMSTSIGRTEPPRKG